MYFGTFAQEQTNTHTHKHTDLPRKGKDSLFHTPNAKQTGSNQQSNISHAQKEKKWILDYTTHTSQNYRFPNNIKSLCNLQIEAPNPGFFSSPSADMASSSLHHCQCWLKPPGWLWLRQGEVGGGVGVMCCGGCSRVRGSISSRQDCPP